MQPARRALQIFLSLGTGAGVWTAGLPAAPQAWAQPHPHASHHAPEGGEGGEGGEAGEAVAISRDVDLLVVLAQMQGHLLVAQELLSQGQVAAAEPHVGHPVDELYGAAEPALRQRGIPPFLTSLEDLRQQVRLNPQDPATARQLARAQQAVTAAVQALPPAVRADPETVMAVVRQLAETAAEEYGAAVAEGRVVEVIEYQDARGFLREAQRQLNSALANQSASRPQLLALQKGISAMLQAFPTATPPQRAVLSADQLQALQRQL